jgi:hypothetical protein
MQSPAIAQYTQPHQFEPLLPVKPEEIRKCGWFKYWTLVSLRKPE